ncbi:MAG: hypothetical protein ACFFAE_14865 [Candidatus Hodarchaeota archaeon]
MIPTQLLFLSFILLVFVLLILLALDVDYLSRLFSHGESWPFSKASSHKNDVGEINRQINLTVQSKNLTKKLIRICPVNAIVGSNEPEEYIIVSETQCLGYACRECLRFVLLKRHNMETNE